MDLPNSSLINQKILCLDIGSKRIGLALWNPAAKLARPFSLRERKTLKEDLHFLENLIKEYEIEAFLIGLPTSLDGKITESTKNALFWVEQVKRRFSLPVYTFDEALSTVEAIQILRKSGSKNKVKKVDSVAAALILEEFIRSHA